VLSYELLTGLQYKWNRIYQIITKLYYLQHISNPEMDKDKNSPHNYITDHRLRKNASPACMYSVKLPESYRVNTLIGDGTF
jgi:hypothetical protein